MWLFTIFLVVVFFYFRRKTRKKKVMALPKPTAVKKKEDKKEDVKETIPLFMFGEGEDIEEVEEGTVMDLSRPFFVEEGEFMLLYKGEEVSRKRKGEVVCYTLRVMVKEEGVGIECRASRKSRIVPIDKVNKYILYSMLRKKCIEVVSGYFQEEEEFIRREMKSVKSVQSAVDLLGEEKIRVLEVGEVLKKKGDPMDFLVYIHHGEIQVGESHFFPSGSFFGYFSLFFDIFASVEIKASKKSRVGVYEDVKRRGLDEEDLEVEYLRGLPDFYHLVDVCSEWRMTRSGTSSAGSGDTFLVRLCQWNTVILPKGLVEMSLKRIPTFAHFNALLHPPTPPPLNIITVLPTDKDTQALLFTRRLKASLGKDCVLLFSRDILLKKVFTVSEELRVMDFLRRMARAYPVVLVYVENIHSRFLKYLLKYSTTILRIDSSSVDSSIDTGDVPPNTQYVRLYEKRTIHTPHHTAYHNVLCPRKSVLFDTKDFERLGRFLLGKRVGLVLGGGGARGIAHIGVIQALEEEGIPIDVVGGTSMGAFIGALYAKACDNGFVFRVTKKFSKYSFWTFLFDLTYPICSFFKGHALDKSLRSTFGDSTFGDLWLEYFCISTNLFSHEEEVHQHGPLWKYLRASMGICGYLPPVCDSRGFLVDGGYLNNVPADVMLSKASIVLAVDVGTVLENDYDPYDPGLLAFFHQYFGTRKYLTMQEIQYRLAFLSTEKKIKDLENNPRVLMIRPDLGDIKTMDFNRFDEIVATGYQSTREIIKKWKSTGVFQKYFPKKTVSRRRYSV